MRYCGAAEGGCDVVEDGEAVGVLGVDLCCCFCGVVAEGAVGCVEEVGVDASFQG